MWSLNGMRYKMILHCMSQKMTYTNLVVGQTHIIKILFVVYMLTCLYIYVHIYIHVVCVGIWRPGD